MRMYVLGKHFAHLICSAFSAGVSSHFVPSLVWRTSSLLPKPQAPNRRNSCIRRLTTANARSHLPYNDALHHAEKKRLVQRAMSEILRMPCQSKTQPWSNTLEPYLPQHLRREASKEINDTLMSEMRPVPVKDLYIWLAEARRLKEPKGDLLTYLAVEEERHDAVVFLVEEALRGHLTLPLIPSTTKQLPILPDQPFPSLDESTFSPEATNTMIGLTGFAGSRLDPLTDNSSHDAAHACLGEIWQSIGAMILEAADRSPTSPKAVSIMTCVHRLLAHLHHVGAIPSSAYNYAPAKNPSAIQRPPTIHYWSLRIMTVISDASWNSLNASLQQDGGVAARLPGTKSSPMLSLPAAEMSSIMPEVEAQIWLDFVLWCCVEGGWITEAAEIICQMSQRQVKGRNYSAIDFNTLRKQHAPRLPWSAQIKASIRRSRMRETAGGNTLGSYSDRIDYLKPPERTVSSEVITAVIDGLASIVSPDPTVFGNDASDVQRYISVCKDLLERKNLGLGCSSWNSIILRIFESLPTTDFWVADTYLRSVISWSPPPFQEALASNSALRSDALTPTYVAEPSAVGLGLLHHMLSDSSLRGSICGTLRIFSALQDIVEKNQKSSLNHFSAAVEAILREEGEDALIRTGNEEQQEAVGLSLELPAHVAAPFLDLVTNVREFESGKWLLHSKDVDGCTIPPSLYSENALQPSLIRFASATGDGELLDKVTQHLEAPIPEAVLRALLHHQIHSARWDAAREILELSHDSGGLAWDPIDIMALASTVLISQERLMNLSSKESQAHPPRALLDDLLRGKYNTAHDDSKPRDLSESRMLNQLVRIIASVPSQLGQDLAPFCRREYDALSGSCTIPTNAFNKLLEAVVDLYGVVEGKALCEKWCLLQDTANAEDRTDIKEIEQVVLPNFQTFCTVLRPLSRRWTDSDVIQGASSLHRHSKDVVSDITSEGKSESNQTGRLQSQSRTTDEERSVEIWGIARCLGLGLRWKDIKRALPSLAISNPNFQEEQQRGESTALT